MLTFRMWSTLRAPQAVMAQPSRLEKGFTARSRPPLLCPCSCRKAEPCGGVKPCKGVTVDGKCFCRDGMRGDGVWCCQAVHRGGG